VSGAPRLEIRLLRLAVPEAVGPVRPEHGAHHADHRDPSAVADDLWGTPGPRRAPSPGRGVREEAGGEAHGRRGPGRSPRPSEMADRQAGRGTGSRPCSSQFRATPGRPGVGCRRHPVPHRRGLAALRRRRRPLQPKGGGLGDAAYTSLAFGNRAAELGIARSFGSTGDCFDNSVVEAVWSTLKRELAWIHGRRTWPTRNLLRSACA